MTNNGTIQREARHYPFGAIRWESGAKPTEQDYDFTGQRLQRSFGLHEREAYPQGYYNARYYDSTLGRFISPDSIVPDFSNPQDLNRYSYVRNSPLNFVDPTGHCIPGVNCAGEEAPTYWAIFYNNPQKIEAENQSQQDNFSCGPTSMSTVMNLKLKNQDVPGRTSGTNIGSVMQSQGYRVDIPKFVEQEIIGQQVTGATHPYQMRDAYNEFVENIEAAGYPNLGTAEVQENATKEDLLNNIYNHELTSVWWTWKSGGAHWVTVAGYDSENDSFLVLNPDPATSGKIQSVGWNDFNGYWSRSFFGIKNTMVTYRQ